MDYYGPVIDQSAVINNTIEAAAIPPDFASKAGFARLVI